MHHIIPTMKYYSKFFYLPTLLFTIYMLLPTTAQAQMFSIGEEDADHDHGIELFSMIGASWEFADFSYTGQGATNRERLDFADSIFRFRFESQGLNLSLGFGGTLTGMDSTSYVNVSGRLFNSLPLIRSESFVLLAPLQISSDLKQVRQNQSEAEFMQSSLTLGSGVSTLFSLGDRISFNIKATPNYGFSFSQGSLFGGTLFRVDGKSLLFIDDLFGSNALSLGYHFDFRKYRIEGNLNDYDYTSHSVTIGYAF